MAETTGTDGFGHLLRTHRQSRGLTQEALAERAGVETRTIQELERGERHPRRETLNSLIEGLGLSGEERRVFVQVAQPNPRHRQSASVSPSRRERSHTGVPQAYPTHLPLALTSCIGREKDMREITHLLASKRLVTLTGAGGCGKTRLALQVAAEVVANYPDGVWVAELTPLGDPDLVAPSVATALRIQCAADRPILAHLVATLDSRQLLLILDNCEHLIDACAHLSETLLRHCPGVQIPATSREALGIGGEMRWRVPSLTLPAFDQETTPVALSDSEAVQLFVERASAVLPRFTLTEQNAPLVAQICRRLDGIPLAIELAATRVESLSLEQIATRLNQRFKLLTTGSRVALPRHQTLAALVGWSYDLLSDAERILFNRLSVLAGGFTLDAAEAVCGDAEDIISLLSNLVDKSLVVADCGAGDVERFTMLETLRQYAAERLDAASESSAVRTRHLGWSTDLTERAEPYLFGAEQVPWLERLDREHDNLRVALTWSIEHSPQAGLRLAGSIWRYWQVRGNLVEGGSHLAALLDRAHEPSAARAKALLGAAILAKQQTDSSREKALLEESLMVYRKLGDKRGIAWVLENLGVAAQDSSDFQTARALLEEALGLTREVGETWRIGWVVRNLAGLAHAEGDLRSAGALHEESLALFKSVGEKRGVGIELIALGNLALVEADYLEARTRFAGALAAYRDIRDQRGVGKTLCHLGIVEHIEGNWRQAAVLYKESLAILRKIGAERNVAETLFWLATLAAGTGDILHARACSREGIAIVRASREVQSLSLFLHLLAVVAECEEAHLRAVRLTAAAPSLRQFGQDKINLIQRAGLHTGLAQARPALGEEAFAMA